jgi:hypothetical protein
MKTANTPPDKSDESVNRPARKKRITQAINAVCSKHDTHLDPQLANMTRNRLQKVDW